jgi:molybdate transport system ATP-binding protein
VSAELEARFRKRFAGGAEIEADLRGPADRFSVTALFGPSGCGKTTTLRCLAGLERPEEGHIRFAEVTWFDAGRRVFLTPQRRGVGYLFQEYALFPHLTVAGNVGYGLTGVPRAERRRRVAAMLDRFRLARLAGRYPRQVSGGEQQRVALARVLVRRPRLLLLDEPLSALDGPTREQLRPELRRLLAGFGVPVVLVTHDRVEATALADQVIVLDEGRVRQAGTAREVFDRPADLAVARIVGVDTVAAGRVIRVREGLATVAIGGKELTAPALAGVDGDVYACIRAEEVMLARGAGGGTGLHNRLEGKVLAVTAEGPTVRVVLDCGFPLTALVTRPASEELGAREGETVTALFKVAAVHLVRRGEAAGRR